MEASGTAPRTGLRADDVPDVRAAFDAEGPVVSVYLELGRAVPQAAERNALAWADLRRGLTERGAPVPALDAIDALVPDAHLRGGALAAIADERGVLVVRHLDRPLARDLGRVGRLPSVGPVLEWQQSQLSHVLAIVDHAGADVYAFGADGAQHQVVGDEPHDPRLQKVDVGGWSQRRYQQRAENRWRANADEAARTVAGAADEIGARFVAVTGNERSRALLMEALPERWRRRAHDLRSEHGIEVADDVGDAVVRLLDTIVASETVALVEKLKEELVQSDRAVNGATPTLAALASARVDTLLVEDDPGDERSAWIGSGPNVAATNVDDVRAMGESRPVEARLVDAAIRAALATGAAVRVVPHLPVLEDGIGAVLRHA